MLRGRARIVVGVLHSTHSHARSRALVLDSKSGDLFLGIYFLLHVFHHFRQICGIDIVIDFGCSVLFDAARVRILFVFQQ